MLATYRGVPYEAGVGPSGADVVLFAACPPPEELGFEPAPGHWRKRVIRAEIDSLWESRPIGTFHGEPCLVLDDLGDRLHIAYLGTSPDSAARLGYWQIDRGVFELLTPREDVTGLTEERVDRPLRLPPPPAAGSVPEPGGTYPYGDASLPAPPPGSAPAGTPIAEALAATSSDPWPLPDPGSVGSAESAAAMGVAGGAGAAHSEPSRPEPLLPEPGLPETGLPETGRPETGRPETGRPEAERPEPASSDALLDRNGRAELAGTDLTQPLPARPRPSQLHAPLPQPDRPQPDLTLPPPAGQAAPAANLPLPGGLPPPPEVSLPLDLGDAPLGQPSPGQPSPGQPSPGQPLARRSPTSVSPPPSDLPPSDLPLSDLPPSDLLPSDLPPSGLSEGLLASSSLPSGLLSSGLPPSGPPEGLPPAGFPPQGLPTPREPASQEIPLPGLPNRHGAPAAQDPPPAGPAQRGPAAGRAAATGNGGRARRQRVATKDVFCELADLAAIPRAAYALEAEVDGVLCLLPTAAGYEVFVSADGARHEARSFADEEAAYFYLFGVLAAEAIRNGLLTPAAAHDSAV